MHIKLPCEETSREWWGLHVYIYVTVFIYLYVYTSSSGSIRRYRTVPLQSICKAGYRFPEGVTSFRLRECSFHTFCEKAFPGNIYITCVIHEKLLTFFFVIFAWKRHWKCVNILNVNYRISGLVIKFVFHWFACSIENSQWIGIRGYIDLTLVEHLNYMVDALYIAEASWRFITKI